MLDWQGALEYFVTIAYEVFSGLMPNRNRPAHLAIILSLRACKSSSGRLREEVLASFPAPPIAIKAAEPGTGNLQQSWLINFVPFFQDEIPEACQNDSAVRGQCTFRAGSHCRRGTNPRDRNFACGASGCGA